MSLSPLWSFTQRVSPERLMRMFAVQSFREVVSLVAEAKIAGYVASRSSKPELQGCKRPKFLLEVSTTVFDIFFNSPAGYRAQYAIAPEIGISQNAYLIESLLDSLSAYAQVHPHPQMSPFEVKASLRLPTAKIWIKEKNETLQGDDLVVEIDYPRWVEEAKSAYYGAETDEHRIKAILGVLAPTGKYLEIKGGWLDDEGEERIDPAKVLRASDIWQYGFS